MVLCFLMRTNDTTTLDFSKTLIAWYERNGRDLPWRHTDDPYKIWVSEIMLQQTQVERVKEYYVRFLERFPDVGSLAAARWEEILEQWRGLGYYRRARNLHAAAKVVANEFGGQFPPEYDELKKLPGIGSYTAAAIACFAFGDNVPAIDTNVEKVFGHVFADRWDGLKASEKVHFVQEHIGEEEGAVFHHAIMDVGTALRAGEPCPFHATCEGLKIERARSHQKIPQNAVRVAAGVLIHEGKVLISKRRADDSFAGYWEFPGGKLEEGEDERACLKREMKEELGIEVSVRPHFYRLQIRYKNKPYILTFHRCSLLLGEPQALEVEEFCWIKPHEFDMYTFPPANAEVIEALQKKKAMWRT